ncbi:hypothetical protein PLESTB_001679800 [Pleodorina starrii]|uniref:Exocyst subunit Exo70 family protein n=1 Tax=Pleodorina starrii TaxID=330485 RepID=A0A9W6BYC7_9CHLO|nr:hypothetical protein PLESTM_001053000 [Pleodorina starrii]GLC60821.1 hypothetical protein PLESTB_001679800 [Pleodorina starrii]GLC66730.1 hypothetical protein PLESTF_000466100 [Pleodorina starrii]
MGLAEQAEQISTALQLHARLSSEGDVVLRSLQEKLSELNRKLAPIHERATALTWAEENITLAKAETNELLQHIDASRKVESVLRLGPGRSEQQLDSFLAAVGRLEAALNHLEAYLDGGESSVGAVEQAYENATDLYDRAMRDCEADFAAVLSQHGAARLPSAAWLTEKASPENLRDSLDQPQLELLPPAAVSRVSRLAEAMLTARHVTCLDTYAQARSRALDMLLALVGLDPAAARASSSASSSSTGPGGLGLQSSDQLQRLVGGWALQLRALLLGAAAELALAQDVWPSPYDEVTFSETISRSLRLVLQVGKAVCEGRGASRSPDRVFVLLQMHQSLMDLLPYLDDLLSARERCTGLLNEAHLLGVMIGRSARQLFGDFEEGVGSRGLQGGGGGGGGGAYHGSDAVSKLTMLDGTVHPICATMLSFLKRLFTYPNALSLLFSPGAGSVSSNGGGGGAGSGSEAAAAAAASSSIMRILMRLMEALEAKARSYKVPALGDLFLMNNVHYMVWTVEQAAAADKRAQQQQQQQQQQRGSASAAAKAGLAEDDDAEEDDEERAAEGDGADGAKRRRGGAKRAGGSAAGDGGAGGAGTAAAAAASGGGGGGGLGVLGSAWVERHKDIVETYGAAYHDKTWRPIISALEAVLVSEEDAEPTDPGRFKAWLKSKFAKINTQLDAIFKQQSAWTIPDAKLKGAVRNVIKQDLLPLYGEFWERYTAVDFTTHPDKYLRYPPEQLEFLIDHTLLEGRAAAAPKGLVGGGGAAVGGGGFSPPPLSSVSSFRSSAASGPPPPPGSVRGSSQQAAAGGAVPAGGRAKSSGAMMPRR